MGSLFGHIYIHFMCKMKKEETQVLYFNLWGQGKKDVYSVYPILTFCSLLHFIKCIKRPFPTWCRHMYRSEPSLISLNAYWESVWHEIYPSRATTESCEPVWNIAVSGTIVTVILLDTIISAPFAINLFSNARVFSCRCFSHPSKNNVCLWIHAVHIHYMSIVLVNHCTCYNIKVYNISQLIGWNIQYTINRSSCDVDVNKPLSVSVNKTLLNQGHKNSSCRNVSINDNGTLFKLIMVISLVKVHVHTHIYAVFLYCCPDCLHCLAQLNSIG